MGCFYLKGLELCSPLILLICWLYLCLALAVLQTIFLTLFLAYACLKTCLLAILFSNINRMWLHLRVYS